MARLDPQTQEALALYDALTPEERSIVMEILRGLASHPAQSDADQPSAEKTTE